MWVPTRHVSLIAVVILVLLLLMIGKVEGLAKKLTPACKRSIKGKYNEGTKSFVSGEEPPLDAKECDSLTVARGKKDGKKRCWKASNGDWTEDTNNTSCNSWTNYVNWSDKDISNAAAGRPWAKVDGWKRKADKNFKGTGDLGDWTVSTTKECATKCNENIQCAAFVFDKNRDKCWGIPLSRMSNNPINNLKEEKGMYTFWRESANIASDSTTSAASTSSTGYPGSPIKKVSEITANGRYMFVAAGGRNYPVLAIADDACSTYASKQSVVAFNSTYGVNAADGNKWRWGTQWKISKAGGGYKIYNYLAKKTTCDKSGGNYALSIGSSCDKQTMLNDDSLGNANRGYVAPGDLQTWDIVDANSKQKVKNTSYPTFYLQSKNEKCTSASYLVLNDTFDSWKPQTWLDTNKQNATKFLIYKV